MKKIDKGTIQPPQCLNKFKNGMDNWNNLSIEDKSQIRDRLNLAQNFQCAFCERKFDQKLKSHIDHFLNKHSYPQYEFYWNNLFNSCNNNDTCGHFKDSPKNTFLTLNIINPDKDEPIDYLTCWISGEIAPTENIKLVDRTLANSTINRLNLNAPRLKSLRKMYLNILEKELEEIEKCNFPDSEKTTLLNEIFEDYKNREFKLALVSYLSK